MQPIQIGIVGVGNCASSLVQGTDETAFSMTRDFIIRRSVT